MVNFLKWLTPVVLSILVWATLNVLSTKGAWFSEPIATIGNSQAFMDATKALLERKSKGNVVLALVKNGQLVDEYSLSKGSHVSLKTTFGVSSLGKWVASVGVMTLVNQGKINLDNPVSQYLTRWQLPGSEFDNEQVTIRRLLSHTGGLTDGLGHDGFSHKADVQPLVEHLSQAKDADPQISGKVLVGLAPGSQFKYSGGSYNLLQLVIEEVSGMAFSHYMQLAVFTPLGMLNTGYDHEAASNLAQYFDENGSERAYPYYTSLAATGLYTTAEDLVRFLQLSIINQDTNGESILSQDLLQIMRTPHAKMMGLSIWGAGPMLFADNNQGGFVIGHGGQSPSLTASARINPSTGNGIIVLTTGNKSLAPDIATQWTLWETGNPDIYMLKNMIPAMIQRTIIGSIIIFLLSLIVVWRKRKQT